MGGFSFKTGTLGAEALNKVNGLKAERRNKKGGKSERLKRGSGRLKEGAGRLGVEGGKKGNRIKRAGALALRRGYCLREKGTGVIRAALAFCLFI